MTPLAPPEFNMRPSCRLPVGLLLAFALCGAAAAEKSAEKAFIVSLENHLPPAERAEWKAYVAQEGLESIAESYYPFGAGACTALLKGTPESYLVENYTSFFGASRGKAIIAAAREVICPNPKN